MSFLSFQCLAQSEVKKSSLREVRFNPHDLRFSEPPMWLFTPWCLYFVFCGVISWCYPFNYLRPDLYLLSGSVPNDETLDQIAQICKERDIVLFSDEMYLLTNNKFDAEKRKPITMVSKYDNAISLFGMSKTFALPGMFTIRDSSCGKVMFSQACVCSWGKGPRSFLIGVLVGFSGARSLPTGGYSPPAQVLCWGGVSTHPWTYPPLRYTLHWTYPPPWDISPRHTHPMTY